MSEQKKSFCIEILSSIIHEEINEYFLCKKEKRVEIDGYESLHELDEIICITKNSLIIIGADLQKIKLKLEYNNINSIENIHIDDENDNKRLVLIKLNEPLIKKEKEINNISMQMNNAEAFINTLSKKFKLYYIQSKGIIKKLPVKTEESLFTSQIDEYTHLEKYKYKSFKYFVLDSDKSDYYFRRYKSDLYNTNARIQIDISDEYPIEKLTSNPNMNDISYYAWSKLCTYLMFDPNGVVILSSNEYKNSDDDIMKEDYKYESITYKLRIQNKIHQKPKNVIYYFIRKKYLPPLYETYIDFMFLFEEYYTEHSVQIDFNEDSLNDFLTMVETFTYKRLPEKNKVSNELIKLKIDAFMVDCQTMLYLHNLFEDTKITRLRMIACIIELKLMQIYEKYEKKSLDYIKKETLIELENLHFLLDDENINVINYEKKLSYLSFNDIMEENYKTIQNIFERYNIRADFLWKNKINNIFEYVIQFHNGNLFKLLNDLVKKVPSAIDEIYLIFKKFVNLCAVTTDNKFIDDVSIHYLINNQDNIKEIMYNSYFLTYFIRSGDLQRIERVDSDLIYGKFLILILNKDIKVLEAVHDYIFSFCKNYLDNEEGASLETSPLQKYSSIFIQKFILILSQSGSNTIPITIALKCLIYLAALSHNNQVDILIDDVITQLVKNLSSFDQNLIYYSLLLIYRFSKHNSESILLLQKYPEIIIKMLNIIKGSKIPESRYHPLIICKVLEIIFNFLNNAQIRNFLLNFTNRKFIKYLFRLIAKKETYTVNNQNYYIKIISLCYGILAEIVSKNVDIRQYIALNYNFFSVMNIKSLEYLEILNYYKIFAKEDNGNTKKELTTFFEHLFHFLVRYVSNDLNQINSAKFKCRNLYSLFYYIKRCQEIQMAPSIIKEVTSLYSRELITNTHLL